MNNSVVDWLCEQIEQYILTHGNLPFNVLLKFREQAKKMEEEQKGYTKEDVLKAGEIGEINHYDYKHIVKLLDEAREINYKSNK